MKTEIRSRKPEGGNRMLKSGKWISVFFVLLISISFSSDNLFAQGSERAQIRDGNKLYKEKKYNDAEVKYKKALGSNKYSIPGNYNLGNAYYKEGKFDEASQQYQSILSNKDLNNDQKAKALHNMGNSMLEVKKYPESIEAFKNSLKLNPKDNETRYNLAYAQSMLQQQQQQNKNDKDKDKKNKDQQNKEQQNKDQKDKEKQDQSKEQQSREKQSQEQDQQKQAGEKKQNISKEDAEKILQALNNDEKNTQKKLIKKRINQDTDRENMVNESVHPEI